MLTRGGLRANTERTDKGEGARELAAPPSPLTPRIRGPRRKRYEGLRGDARWRSEGKETSAKKKKDKGPTNIIPSVRRGRRVTKKHE